MIEQLAVATALVIATVLVHGLGLIILSRALQIERLVELHRHGHISVVREGLVTLAVVMGLFLLHGIEIWIYAAFYLATGAFDTLQSALYFSTITYSTIGYDDEGMARAWQLVAAIEGINGVILLGWSTAFFVSLLGRIRRRH